MIKTNLGLYSVEETVVRPVLVQVVSDIKSLLGLTNEIFTIYDPKDAAYKQQNKTGNITGQTGAYDEVIKIDFQDLSEDGTELSLVTVNPDYEKVYIDNELKSYAVPIYQRRRFTMNFTYSSKSGSKVDTIINKLRLMVAGDRMYKTHNLEYHFILPPIFLKFLIEVVRLKNIRLNPQITLEEYINGTFDNRVDFSETLDGNGFKSDVVIRERQLGIIGYITEDLHNIAKEIDDTSGMTNVTFGYELIFEKPVVLRMQYPILIYNTLIDPAFRDIVYEKGTPKTGIRTMGTSGMFDITARNISCLAIPKDKYYIAIPSIDTFVLDKPPSYFARLVSVMVTVDPNNLKDLFNIRTDLEVVANIKFKDSILDLMINYFRDTIAEMYGSVFYFELYKNEQLDGSNPIVLDIDGNLTTTNDMDIKAIYRVVINMVTDMSVLNSQAALILKRYLEAEMTILNIKKSNYTTFLEYYAILFNIPQEEVLACVAKNQYKNTLFKITEPVWIKFFTKELVINLTGIMDEKMTSLNQFSPIAE